MIEILLYSAVAFLTSLMVTPIARRMALRKGILDIPNERSSHTLPTPRTGGVGIIVATIVAVLLTWCLRPVWFGAESAWLGLTLILSAGVGFVDDWIRLPTPARMILYLGIAGLLASMVFRPEVLSIPGIPEINIGVFGGVLFSVLFAAWYTNLFNFMDGIDGIAGCTATVTMGALGLAFSQAGEHALACLAIAAAASSVGFLFFNFPPASIFMGDGGAVFIGMMAGALTLGAIEKHVLSLAAAVFMMLPFVFDATFTLLRRMVIRERFWKAHRSHVYQQLCDLGLSHRAVTTIYTSLSVVCAALGLVLDRLNELAQILVFWLVLASFVSGAVSIVMLRNRRPSQIGAS